MFQLKDSTINLLHCQKMAIQIYQFCFDNPVQLIKAEYGWQLSEQIKITYFEIGFIVCSTYILYEKTISILFNTK